VIALVEYLKNLNSDYRIQQTLNTADLPPDNEARPAGKAPAAPVRGGQGEVKQ